MEWRVYFHDFNGQKIVPWNIFKNWRFKESVEKLVNNKKLDREEFREKLRIELMYNFWSKTEYEVIIKPWVGDGDEIKVDIYDQVMLNFDKFVNYVWSFKKGAKNGKENQ